MEKVTFTDPETNESVDFVVEDETMMGGTRYLLVSEESASGDSDAYLMKEIRSEGEESVYEMVEDEVELAALADIFSELLDEDTDLVF